MAVGEGKYATGEGRRIEWDEEGEEFVVGFERGAVVFDIECKVRSVVVPRPSTKVHQMAYVREVEGNVLAVSTEDGRILFFDTAQASGQETNGTDSKGKEAIPHAKLIAQLGGRALGVSSRIKDFSILSHPTTSAPTTETTVSRNLVITTASSDGVIRLWSLSTGELDIAREAAIAAGEKVPQVGHLLAQYETGNRITCLAAFVMNEKSGGVGEADVGEESEFGGFSEAGGEESSEESESE